MPLEISLTSFTDFVAKVGAAKYTVAKNVAEQLDEGYDPRTDFWKKLREGIISLHKEGHPKSELDVLAKHLTDPKKRKRYPPCIKGYKKFLGNNPTPGKKPKSCIWLASDLAIRINPEVLMDYKGQPHLLKLYFKEQALRKAEVDTVLYLLREYHPVGKKAIVGLVDVARGRLIPYTKEKPGMSALIEGEAASFAHMLRSAGLEF